MQRLLAKPVALYIIAVELSCRGLRVTIAHVFVLDRYEPINAFVESGINLEFSRTTVFICSRILIITSHRRWG